MKKLFTLLVKGYQLFFGPFLGNCCRFHPSCSNYAIEAIEKHGAAKGVWLTCKRVCKCHPWHAGGTDFP